MPNVPSILSNKNEIYKIKISIIYTYISTLIYCLKYFCESLK